MHLKKCNKNDKGVKIVGLLKDIALGTPAKKVYTLFMV